MTILVCPLSKVLEMVERHKPGRVISLLDPDFTFPDLGPAYAGKHLRLRFHDVDVANEYEIGPSAQHVDRLLQFLRSSKATHVLPQPDCARARFGDCAAPGGAAGQTESGDGCAGRHGDVTRRADERRDREYGARPAVDSGRRGRCV